MKKLMIFIFILICIFCSSCSNNNKNDSSKNEVINENANETIFGGYFTVIDEWKNKGEIYRNRIVYDNNSKVKYFVSYYTFNSGRSGVVMTPLYNKDGSLQVYEE